MPTFRRACVALEDSASRVARSVVVAAVAGYAVTSACAVAAHVVEAIAAERIHFVRFMMSRPKSNPQATVVRDVERAIPAKSDAGTSDGFLSVATARRRSPRRCTIRCALVLGRVTPRATERDDDASSVAMKALLRGLEA